MKLSRGILKQFNTPIPINFYYNKRMVCLSAPGLISDSCGGIIPAIARKIAKYKLNIYTLLTLLINRAVGWSSNIGLRCIKISSLPID